MRVEESVMASVEASIAESGEASVAANGAANVTARVALSVVVTITAYVEGERDRKMVESTAERGEEGMEMREKVKRS